MDCKAESSKAITQNMRESSAFMRITSSMISLLFLYTLFFPSLLAVKVAAEENALENRIQIEGTTDHQMSQTLQVVQESTAETHETIQQRLAESGVLDDILNFIGLSRLAMEDDQDFAFLKNKLNELEANALSEFDVVDAMLKAKGLSEAMIAKNQEAKERFKTKLNDLQQKLDAVLSSNDLVEQGEHIEALNNLLSTEKQKRSHQTTDPNHLPWGTPDAKQTPELKTTAVELEERTLIKHPMKNSSVLLAAHVIPEGMLDSQRAGPLSEDLAETPDIQLTDSIRAKAAELNYDPVTIYNWVRNTIEFIPSYGSIQGADYTLQSGKGNAMDTASLVIALLRASNIPARYAFGTVDIPAHKAMNWVGGVDVPAAAQQLFSQGGIPNKAIVKAGAVKTIRIEHTWAEAWVDYYPSRGAKHKVGDSWIPLDASFKQYDFTEGQDIAGQISFDSQTMIDELTASGTVNEADGFVQGLDQSLVQTTLEAYQQQVQDYINSQNPEMTLGELLGTQKVIQKKFRQLAAGLPYRLEARTHNFSELPDTVRHKFRYTLGTQNYGREGSRLITIEKNLSELAGKKLALAFKPTTDEDAALLESYVPEPDPGTGEIDHALIPQSIPGYLIGLTAEFLQDGETLFEASAGNMGTELIESMQMYAPNFGWSAPAINHPIAGEYRAIGLDLQGANPEDAAKLNARMQATQAKLESADAAQLATLTKHELVGDMLYATVYSYFALNDLQDQIQAKASNVVNYRLPSFGLFTTQLNPVYWFGVPRNVEFTGLGMDVDWMVNQLAAKNNSKDERLAFMRSMGMRGSAMEHQVPEMLFSTDDGKVHGISAVKALSIAGEQGQKIWTIDSNNISMALADINLSADIENEIRNAVNAGNIAITHQGYLDFYGTQAAGYLLLDPDTGAGAYKIASGSNGGLTLMTVGAGQIYASGFIIFLAATGTTVATGGLAAPAAYGLFTLASIASIASGLSNILRGLAFILDLLGEEDAADFLCSGSQKALSISISALIGVFLALGLLQETVKQAIIYAGANSLLGFSAFELIALVTGCDK
ncbi:MAG: transglutaminase-like domain-containing protein [Cellvibrionales bacterium]|nr:transglutaminase-like domain-containing protein [Cellvibrionales bacterium]